MMVLRSGLTFPEWPTPFFRAPHQHRLGVGQPQRLLAVQPVHRDAPVLGSAAQVLSAGVQGEVGHRGAVLPDRPHLQRGGGNSPPPA